MIYWQMFSSIAALLGGVGQGNYAAANAALDAAAVARQAQGVPGKSVQWGAWYGVGMAMRDTGTVQRAERFGIGMVMPNTGLSVLAEFMSESRGSRALLPAVWLASPFVWSTFLKLLPNPGIFTEFSLEQQQPIALKPRRTKSRRGVRKTASTKDTTGGGRGS